MERATRPGAETAVASPRSMPLGRLLGVPLEVHWSFSLLLALVAFTAAPRGAAAVAAGLAWVVALFACVVVHELAHCIVARRKGATVRRIVLLPIGGVSQLEAMPEAPRDEFDVAAVGPLTSFVLAVALGVVAVAAGAHLWPPTLIAGNWWVRLAWLNALLAVFNVLPALPMDGGRMLRATLARHRPRAQATAAAARVARVIGSAMILVGILFDFWLVLIGIFVVLGAAAEQGAALDADGAPRLPGGAHDPPSDEHARSSAPAVGAGPPEPYVRQGGTR